MQAKFTAIIEHDAHGFYAYCPELKGCHTQGHFVEEALAHLREAAELYVESCSAGRSGRSKTAPLRQSGGRHLR